MNTMEIKVNGKTYTITALNSAGMGQIARFACNGWYSDEEILKLAHELKNSLTVTSK